MDLYPYTVSLIEIGVLLLDVAEEAFLLLDNLGNDWILFGLMVSPYEAIESLIGNTGNKTRNLADANAFKSTETKR